MKTATSLNQYFTWEHLRDEELKEVSKQCATLAEYMKDNLEDGPEKTAGMRKLLEAKDCFVRAKLTEQSNKKPA